MKYMMLALGNADYEAGKPPSPELMQAVGELAEKAVRSGKLVFQAGLQPTRAGWRTRRARPLRRPRHGDGGPAALERLFYRFVRHPIMLGFIIAFWSAPTMSMGHLLFAAVTTTYILVALRLEERDLLKEHGTSYASYRERVPMLVPGTKARRGARGPAGSTRHEVPWRAPL